MKNDIFSTSNYKKLEQRVFDLLNSQPDFLSMATRNSTRAVGDAIQDILSANLTLIVGDLGINSTAEFARRAMADLAFNDNEGNYYMVDVKTHRVDTAFNMPNLTSVDRLAKFYASDKNYFVILKIDYAVENTKATIKKVTFVPIEYLSWDCLTIGALGKGQIQIANSNFVKILPNNSRKDWMLEMCEKLLRFYPAEIVKINKRIEDFKKVQKYWQKAS